MRRTMTLAGMALSILILSQGSANGQTVLAPQEAGKLVQIRDLSATPSLVTGVVVNNTPHIIRDVQLLIQYHWLWSNEFKPGPVSPGRVVAIKVDKELNPGESAAFRYSPDPPLSQQQDGQYNTEVGIAGFTIVSSGATAAR
jgi:hypothetical protein